MRRRKGRFRKHEITVRGEQACFIPLRHESGTPFWRCGWMRVRLKAGLDEVANDEGRGYDHGHRDEQVLLPGS